MRCRRSAIVLASFAAFLAFTHIGGVFHTLPKLLEAYQADLDQRRPAWSWISANTPPSANVYAYDDPLLYLYTGRHSCNLPIPPRLYYHHDDQGIDRLLATIPDFARDQHLDYALLTTGDFYRDLHQHGERTLAHAVETSPEFHQVFHSGTTTLYLWGGAPAPQPATPAGSLTLAETWGGRPGGRPRGRGPAPH